MMLGNALPAPKRMHWFAINLRRLASKFLTWALELITLINNDYLTAL